jgi:leader peptidase (prepilin peptidase)/N-methyltransferase
VSGPLEAGMVAGLAWGLASDRIAARWPRHDDGSVRRIDWRTPAVGAAGALAGLMTASRYGGGDPATLALMTVEVAALVLLFATDLDQRLLPNVVTYPLVILALLAFAVGAGPFVRTPAGLAVAAVAAVLIPLLLFAISVPFGRGAIGLGDLKLLVSVGLLGGAWRLIVGLLAGAILAAAVILVLLAARRITLRSYVPYGPFLIVGALWALLVLAG